MLLLPGIRRISSNEDGPIIELPESPSPPPQTDDTDSASRTQIQSLDDDDDDDDDDDEEVAAASRAAGTSHNGTMSRTGHMRGGSSHNTLGVQPRKPIRTHQASPLATHSSSPALARHLHQYGHSSGKR